MSYDDDAEEIIPAEVIMYSGCQDCQTSADVSNVGCFKLPDPAGRAGGALTSCMLKVLYSEEKAPTDGLTILETLENVRNSLEKDGFEQIPQLTSSRRIDLNKDFEIAPEGCTGTRRALMIGINYPGTDAELSGCHNDVFNLKKYLMDVHGFEEENITILMDDGDHLEPTGQNIFSAFENISSAAEPGDALWVSYSGHGCSIPDDDGDEEDGMDECLCPADFQEGGVIRDDDVFKYLVKPLPKGVTLTCLMDCCHSGTILDLPYQYRADSDTQEMTENKLFVPGRFKSFLAGLTGRLGRRLWG